MVTGLHISANNVFNDENLYHSILISSCTILRGERFFRGWNIILGKPCAIFISLKSSPLSYECVCMWCESTRIKILISLMDAYMHSHNFQNLSQKYHFAEALCFNCGKDFHFVGFKQTNQAKYYFKHQMMKTRICFLPNRNLWLIWEHKSTMRSCWLFIKFFFFYLWL